MCWGNSLPLVPLLGNKRLDSLPPRILRYRLRLDKFDFKISHVPGKQLYAADTLSRAPISGAEEDSLELQEEVETFIAEITRQALSSAELHLEEYHQKQSEDPICSQVMEFCYTQWPSKGQLRPDLIPFWKVRDSLSMYSNLLLFNDRILVPESLQKDVMKRVHEGHQGIECCRARLRLSVWWPKANQHVSVQSVLKLPERGENPAPHYQVFHGKLLLLICLSWTRNII